LTCAGSQVDGPAQALPSVLVLGDVFSKEIVDVYSSESDSPCDLSYFELEYGGLPSGVL
jgi:hypothetical protein